MKVITKHAKALSEKYSIVSGTGETFSSFEHHKTNKPTQTRLGNWVERPMESQWEIVEPFESVNSEVVIVSLSGDRYALLPLVESDSLREDTVSKASEWWRS